MNMRRFSDVVIAFVLLLVCLPALVFSCLALWIEQSAFPIVRSERATRSGRIVHLYRLRTTYVTSFGARRTAVGELLHRAHMDQIPQLLNVLSGELSLGGSRHPLHPEIGTRSLLALREP